MSYSNHVCPSAISSFVSVFCLLYTCVSIGAADERVENRVRQEKDKVLTNLVVAVDCLAIDGIMGKEGPAGNPFAAVTNGMQVTVAFVLPSTNQQSDVDIEGMVRSKLSVRLAVATVVKALADRDRIAFEFSKLYIQKGHVDISNGTFHMRFLPNDEVESLPGGDVPGKTLKFGSDLKAYFIASTSNLVLTLNNTTEVVSGRRAPYREYGFLSFPVSENRGRLSASVNIETSLDFEGKLGCLRDITASFH